jgi:peptide-methionine (S)-S-oxide reductase
MVCLIPPRASRGTLSALLGLITALAAFSAAAPSTARAENAVTVPAPLIDAPKVAGPPQTAVLAGGCFWGVQGVFEHLTGVRRVLAGYSGGARTTAHYELVGTGGTGHAESVEIVYDPQLVSYGEILQVFFSVAHDPTQLNRQGPDEGTQYRSAIFYATPEQKAVAEAYIQQLDAAKLFRHAIVTKVVALDGFYAAEAYHQHFLDRNPTYPYIVYNDLPKLAQLKKDFPEMLKRK